MYEGAAQAEGANVWNKGRTLQRAMKKVIEGKCLAIELRGLV